MILLDNNYQQKFRKTPDDIVKNSLALFSHATEVKFSK